MEIHSDRPADFWARSCTVRIGDVTLMSVRSRSGSFDVIRIRKFIDTHLSDPALTPDAVAVAHFISPRPDLVHHTVRTIAARWGFTDQAQFSRVFRRHYGTTPRACRAETDP